MDKEAISSMLTNAKNGIGNAETSDSFDSNYHPFRANKRPKLDRQQSSNNNNNNNAVTAKFKGVVPQQNGHWGAQIYANHQRIWLGTFKSEKEAAMAYDSAAIKLRSGDSHRNFPWTDKNIQEPEFQSKYTTEAVLNMIRDGSYQPKFADFLRIQSRKQEAEGGASFSNQKTVHGSRSSDHGQFSCIQLFQKELTPSDVGKLNRLVIPKKFAVKYFSYISNNGGGGGGGAGGEDVEEEGSSGIDDVELVFYDRLMKCWKFRYCYWRSSQSFVFTRGWNRFVKEKNLREKDIVTFYACACQDFRVQEVQHFSLIDISYSNGESCVVVEGVDQIEEKQKELELNLGQNIRSNSILQNNDLVKELKGEINGLKGMQLKNNNNPKGKGLKLFGVRID